MKISSIVCLCLLTAGVSVPRMASAATNLTGDQNIVGSGMELGSLSITGDLTTAGAVMSLGTTSGSTQAIQWTYFPSSTPPVLSVDLFDSAATVMWRQNAAATAVEKMELNDSNQLSLFAPSYNFMSPSAGIVTLTPSLGGGGSTITLDGQQVLTQGSGDARYLQQGGTNWSVGGSSSVSGAGSFALGNSAFAVGDSSQASVAMGTGSVAYTNTSGGGHAAGVAIGYHAQVGSSAANGGGIAIGIQAVAQGVGVAIGQNASASTASDVAIGYQAGGNGGQSNAIGAYAVANGYQSTALGSYVIAYNMSETVVGAYNLAEPGAHASSHASADNLFVIGNGTAPGSLSNALVVQWNGDATVSGNTHVTKVLTADQGGHFGDTVHLEPRGGLSMGSYTYDPGSP